LEAVGQDLTLLTNQGKVVGFLTNTENAQRLNGLVGDILKAMADYKVCIKSFILTMSDVCTSFHYNKIPTTIHISSQQVSPLCLAICL